MKYLLPVLFIVLAITACRRSNTGNVLTRDNTALAANYFAAFNAHDWDSLSRFYADTAIFLDPAYGNEPVRKTRSNIVAHYMGLAQAMPDIKDSITAMYTDRDKVIVEFVATGTTAAGKFKLPICTIFTIKNKKIVKDASYYDN